MRKCKWQLEYPKDFPLALRVLVHPRLLLSMLWFKVRWILGWRPIMLDEFNLWIAMREKHTGVRLTDLLELMHEDDNE